MSRTRATLFATTTLLLFAAPRQITAQKADERSLARVATHDNTAPAGRLQNGVLRLSLHTARSLASRR